MEKTKKTNLLNFFLILPVLAIIAAIDFYTGYDIDVTVFYLLPVLFVAWNYRYLQVILISAFCALLTIFLDVLGGKFFMHPAIPFWNGFVLFLTFATAGFFLTRLQQAAEKERLWARTDYLTGLYNRMGFFEEFRGEITRAARSNKPFSLVYIDLDNFKTVNDRFGHDKGDEVLKMISSGIKKNVRPYDKVARMGGDEFLILFPETGACDVDSIVKQIKLSFEELAVIEDVRVTISAGVMTFEKTPDSLDEAIAVTDTLMYEAKKNGKNALVFDRYPHGSAV
jgi:diguanylate cyclase (GGDEF)-like protein